MLDADEECDPALIAEIQHLDESTLAHVGLCRMPRRNYLAGRYVRCWSPDWQTRLIHRDRVLWDPASIPETRRCKPGFTQRPLRGSLLHDRRGLFRRTDLINGPQMAAYAEDLAESLRQRGQHASLLNLLFRPPLTFLKYYLLRRGFLDGRFGLIIAYKTTIGVMLKYTALYAKEELEAKTKASDQ
jgi:(heptosyl)LPS beta-1,4-glucosyltransferase